MDGVTAANFGLDGPADIMASTMQLSRNAPASQWDNITQNLRPYSKFPF